MMNIFVGEVGEDEKASTNSVWVLSVETSVTGIDEA